jgi:hypothetical protein
MQRRASNREEPLPTVLRRWSVAEDEALEGFTESLDHGFGTRAKRELRILLPRGRRDPGDNDKGGPLKLRVAAVGRTLALGLMVVAGCLGQTSLAVAETPKLVRNTAALQAALATARSGDRILLAPGNYERLGLRGLKFGGEVTIASADPVKRAVVAGIEMASVSGLRFENLELTVNDRNEIAFSVGGQSDRVTLDGAVIHDPVNRTRSAILIRSSTDIVVKNSELFDVGTALRILDSRNVTVANTRFHDLRGDGIQGAGSSYVTLTGNNFSNFYPKPGDHPDAMQFFTLNTKASATNLTFTNNVFVRGAGAPVQGIFLGNEIRMPYQQVVITGNTLLGTMYNGIAVDVADDVTIANNTVQAYADMNSWIIVQRSSNAKITNNRAGSFIYKGENKHLSEKGNKTLKAARVGDLSALKARASE